MTILAFIWVIFSALTIELTKKVFGLFFKYSALYEKYLKYQWFLKIRLNQNTPPHVTCKQFLLLWSHFKAVALIWAEIQKLSLFTLSWVIWTFKVLSKRCVSNVLLVPALRRQRPANLCEIQVSRVHTASSRRVGIRETLSKKVCVCPCVYTHILLSYWHKVDASVAEKSIHTVEHPLASHFYRPWETFLRLFPVKKNDWH